MIKLKYFDQTVVDTHLKKLSDHAKKRLGDLISKKLDAATLTHVPPADLNDLVVYFRSKVKDIVVAKPAELREFITATSLKLGWLEIILAKDAEDRDDWEKDIVSGLQWVFDYGAFSRWKHPKWGAYELVEKYNLRICAYCHTSHLNFHFHSEKDMRPPLDHFYPRSRYPYLGTSLYNLIPSCYQCNSTIKGDHDPLAKALTHPFEIGNKSVQFRMRLAGGERLPRNPVKMTAKQIEIEVTGIGACRTSVKFFILPQRYQWYKREIAEVYSRVLSYRDLGGTLENLAGVKRLVYGFREEEAQDYALGICIKDIADSLILSYSP
ncbi:HNH endonuclease [Rugamonas aquatica]|uniref:HNH endonuclease n=1 Tax=Rugamonas aquatica TaxID=2743357 RepID=A0A6A7MUW1_9BURK|nr:hypothetical protein [Rugamonas aquatica]MQA36791.1 hypothetical protein [Rugamonas aquatica]